MATAVDGSGTDYAIIVFTQPRVESQIMQRLITLCVYTAVLQNAVGCLKRCGLLNAVKMNGKIKIKLFVLVKAAATILKRTNRFRLGQGSHAAQRCIRYSSQLPILCTKLFQTNVDVNIVIFMICSIYIAYVICHLIDRSEICV